MKLINCVKCNVLQREIDFYKYGKKYQKMYGKKFDYYCKSCRVGSSLKSHRSRTKSKLCTFLKCSEPHYAKDLCRPHYAGLLRNGSPVPITGRVSDRQYSEIILYSYGITSEQYLQMSQDGCNVCGVKKSSNGRRLQIDHDHLIKKYIPVPAEAVRGVVCHRCNVALGKYDKGIMRQDFPLKKEVADYIDRYTSKRASKGQIKA